MLRRSFQDSTMPSEVDSTQITSADNGRLKVTISGPFCAVTIDQAMYKDSGDWHIIVGTGKSLAAFKKKDYVYPVEVSGKYI